jgi:hypothetical protein
MEAMGLKVGDRVEFMRGNKTIGVVFTKIDEAYLRDCNDDCTVHITYILGTEYTILPRYTLTEDEKAIVRSITNNGFEIIKKCGGNLYLGCDDYDRVFEFPFDNLFKFIKVGENVSIDELRECL